MLDPFAVPVVLIRCVAPLPSPLLLLLVPSHLFLLLLLCCRRRQSRLAALPLERIPYQLSRLDLPIAAFSLQWLQTSLSLPSTMATRCPRSALDYGRSTMPLAPILFTMPSRLATGCLTAHAVRKLVFSISFFFFSAHFPLPVTPPSGKWSAESVPVTARRPELPVAAVHAWPCIGMLALSIGTKPEPPHVLMQPILTTQS